MDHQTVFLVKEADKKNSVRYKAESAMPDGTTPAVQTIYVMRTALVGRTPERIKLTLEETE